MVLTTNEKKDLQLAVINFIESVCKKKSWNTYNISELFKNGIKFKVSEHKHDCTKCIANVCNGNEIRQCSRKKKFGDFCGLHVKIQSKLKSGTINNSSLSIKHDIIYLNMNKKENNYNSNTPVNNFDVPLDKYFSVDNDFYDLYWKGINYVIDANNNVYYDDYDELLKIGILRDGIIVSC